MLPFSGAGKDQMIITGSERPCAQDDDSAATAQTGVACLHDGADAHGVSLLGHQILVAVKEALVGLDGGFSMQWVSSSKASPGSLKPI